MKNMYNCFVFALTVIFYTIIIIITKQSDLIFSVSNFRCLFSFAIIDGIYHKEADVPDFGLVILIKIVIITLLEGEC